MTFVLWGVLYGVLIIFERAVNIDTAIQKSRIFGALYRLFTCVCIIILWVFFRAESVGQAFSYVGAMFDITNRLNNIQLLALYLTEYKWELTGCILLSMLGCPERLKNSNLFQIGKMMVLYVLFIISISYLVKGTYSPFIYFNF